MPLVASDPLAYNMNHQDINPFHAQDYFDFYCGQETL